MSSCIISPLTKDKDGYPRIKFNKRSLPAGRLLWQIMYGELSEGELVLHTCDNPSCVNPEHLYKGSFQQNMEDKVDRARVAGERNPNCRLSDKDVAEIKRLYNDVGLSQQKIASMYGTSQSHISHLVLGRRKKTR